MLFTVLHHHFYAETAMYVLGQVLRTVDASVLTTCTAEAEHERGESPLDIPCHMCIGQFVHTVEEGKNLTVILKEGYHRPVESGEMFVLLISSRIVRASAVEHISPTVARRVGRNALFVREAIDTHHERSLCVVA